MMEAVCEWCIERIGEGYIYGAAGQTCSPSFRKQQAEQYPSQAETILNVGAKWDGHRVWDCAQLTRYAAKQGGVSLVSGATSQWNKTNWKEKGSIGGLPVDEVCFLYRSYDGKMQHTGIYLGDRTFVHAKGTAYGVLRQNLNEYNWTHYAVPYWGEEQCKYEEVKNVEIIRKATVIPNTLNVRKSPSASSARVGVLNKGENVEIIAETDDWSEIIFEGSKSYVMRKYLTSDANSVYSEKERLETLREQINALIDTLIDSLG